MNFRTELLSLPSEMSVKTWWNLWKTHQITLLLNIQTRYVATFGKYAFKGALRPGLIELGLAALHGHHSSILVQTTIIKLLVHIGDDDEGRFARSGWEPGAGATTATLEPSLRAYEHLFTRSPPALTDLSQQSVYSLRKAICAHSRMDRYGPHLAVECGRSLKERS